jgi:hypothetical protein|nr:MAG TPA: tail assembly chaperone protein [Caudoviricetes sp.]
MSEVKSETSPQEDKIRVKKMVPDDVKVINVGTEEESVDNIVHLSQKYSFDDEIIETIDLRGIEDVSGADMQKAESLYRKITKNISSTPEITVDYAIAMAHVITGKPVEFFKNLNAKDVIRIKNRVVNFLYTED